MPAPFAGYPWTPRLERAAKSNTCKETASVKIPLWVARRDICCVRFPCTGRAWAESAPETEAAFFLPLSPFYALLSCFVFRQAAPSSRSECKPCCFSIPLSFLKRTILLSSLRLSEWQPGQWKGYVLRSCCPEKKGEEWDMTLREMKAVVQLQDMKYSTCFFKMYFLIKMLINIWSCLVVVSKTWCRLKGP